MMDGSGDFLGEGWGRDRRAGGRRSSGPLALPTDFSTDPAVPAPVTDSGLCSSVLRESFDRAGPASDCVDTGGTLGTNE